MNVFKLIEENGLNLHGDIEHFAELIRQEEREKVAAWMMARGYATGHGDTIEDLLVELEWQVRESEREACAKVCEDRERANLYGVKECAAAIRARGNK
jgi:hypothetical protein